MMEKSRSFEIRLRYTSSHEATITPLYSAYMLDSAIVGCFLLLPRYGSATKGEDEYRSSLFVSLVADPINICVPFRSSWCGRFVEDVGIHCPTYIA